jgi:hypothetical protein
MTAATYETGSSLARLRTLGEHFVLGNAPRTWIETCGRLFPFQVYRGQSGNWFGEIKRAHGPGSDIAGGEHVGCRGCWRMNAAWTLKMW